MMATKYPVDLDTVRLHFPPHFPVPPLLEAFAKWLAKRNAGTLGAVRFFSYRWDDYFEEAGDFYHHFAMFLRTADGGMMGYWLPEGRPHPNPPVVMIGSEGQLATLGLTLADFLSHWAKKDLRVETDLDMREGDDGPALLGWLRKQELPTGRESVPEFPTWFTNQQAVSSKWCDENPARLEIAKRLRKLAPPPADAPEWWTANFDVVIVGNTFQMWHRHYGPQRLPSTRVADLEPLLREDRSRRARLHPERGLWFQAYVSVLQTGGAHIRADFWNEPSVGDKMVRIADREYGADNALFPRSKHWTPAWLAKRLK
jgi:hypothetical protein